MNNQSILRTGIAVAIICIVGSAFACKENDSTTTNIYIRQTAVPLTCEYKMAMDSCCPTYCIVKNREGGLKANERFLACASGFGCGKTDIFSSRCEFTDDCKK